MSACGDFAEHVWKPGSCKNCFHPLSAHKTRVSDDNVPPTCLKSSLGGDEEGGVTAPSPYSKPTIAVKPTMMSFDTSEMKDVNMNIEQVSFLNDCLYFKNANGDSCWQQNNAPVIGPKSTYNERSNFRESNESTVEIPLSVDGVPSEHTTVHHNPLCSSGINTKMPSTSTAYTTVSSVESTNHISPTSLSPIPALSKQNSFSDSPSSYHSSTDSLPGPDGSVEQQNGLGIHQSPSATGSPESTPSSPSVQEDSEPIYAESTKRKPKPLGNGLLSCPESQNQIKQSKSSESERSGESQRATITVMAAHTENNRTFFLSSPDSGVGTQCHFSPTACKDPSSPPQSSPPIPPKRSSRSPKLGTSSLSPSMSSPILLPEFPKLGTSSLSASLSSPIPLPELPMLFLVSAREGHFKGPTDNQCATSERLHKSSHHSPGWNCRIEEEEEEEDQKGMEKKKKQVAASLGITSQGTGPINGAAVWKEANDCKIHSSPPPMTEPGTAPPAASNNDACQRETEGSRDATRMSCSSPFPRTPVASAPGSPHLSSFSSLSTQPPPLPEKKMVNRTVSAPDTANGKPFIRAYPRFPFAGSESNVCRSTDAASRTSLPSSPVDPRPVFSSNESLERCHLLLARPSRSRTLDEQQKTQGRLGVHCRTSITCLSSPQLSAPFSASEAGSAPNLGSSMQLQTLLSNIDSREGVYSKLGGLYAESLRRLALKCEDHFTRSQKNPLRFDESNWSLFRLTSNKPSCNAGDAVYYSAACASDPRNSYAVKTPESKQAASRSIPPHFNIQQDCGHFLACVPQSMLPSNEVSLPAALAPTSPHCAASAQGQQAEQERVVVITPEIPHQTTADFVREWEAFHKTQPEVYERRVCFLLLQLCNGLEHLKEHGVTHRDLCLENLLLIPHQQRPAHLTQQSAADGSACNGAAAGDVQRHLPRLLISNFAKAKRRSSEDAASTNGDPRIKRDHARLAPEIVSAAQYRKFDEFQAGILIYELLHLPNPFEVSPALREQDYRCEDLPPVPPISIYSVGLQKLAQLLLQPDPIKRIHIQEAKRILQSLLWGPRKDLMEQQWERHRRGGGFVDGSRNEGLLNWLDVKRALLMMKFAERSLEPERNAELEDWLCCQYFSTAHPLSLCHTAELLYSLK
uniref:Protein kinase domain-containing protein n=1 Tax=Xiphophorus couchianus TaxID=32473 RepID=A0A3B5KT63_9TELE